MISHILNWQNIHLNGDLWLQHHRIRYQSFVGRQNWDVPHHDGLEWDQYDNPRASYILISQQGRCLACCRLISSVHPYMIEEVFPDFLPYAPPKKPKVWEASRIAVDNSLAADIRNRALCQLIIAIQQFGLENGIEKYLGLMPVAIFNRVLVRNGVCLKIHQGKAGLIDGKKTATADILVDPRTVDYLQSHLVA
ncbi:hypothetical protein O4H49_12920 [Kiloniella laminariae]|uniref:Acyl-homoserine-lactone synthase n=1 Tax=Kiloniella laminariae TaxID=454162 RepID=A0ABT4LL59_9PROT|nr:acyl-homoserine-lactone synthase [Kiloniella laminariae]MCZ4281685.1 hypothetical protein [Kiloniella laminariae]